MKLRLSGCLVAVCLVGLGWVGCSDDGVITHGDCLSSCAPNNVTFMLATPLSWRQIEIAVGFPDGSVDRLDCQPGDGSIACIPVPQRVRPLTTCPYTPAPQCPSSQTFTIAD